MGEVIVVTSGKGGVGKTTTTANLGTGLAMEGKECSFHDYSFKQLIASGQQQAETTTIHLRVIQED